MLRMYVESMKRDLKRVSVWCNLWGMKLNASKTIPFLVFLWNDLANPVFDGVGLSGPRAGPMLLYPYP